METQEEIDARRREEALLALLLLLAEWPRLSARIQAWAKSTVSVVALAALAEEARGWAFRAKRFWDQALLKTVYTSAHAAALAGKSLEQWIKESWPAIATQFGKPGEPPSPYVRVVVRTAVQGAFAAGRYAEMFSPQRIQEAPYWVYISMRDERVRPRHRALDGKVFLKTDQSALQYLPPWEINCRCRAEDMTVEAFLAGGYVVTHGSDVPGLPALGVDGKPLRDKHGRETLFGTLPANWGSPRSAGLSAEAASTPS